MMPTVATIPDQYDAPPQQEADDSMASIYRRGGVWWCSYKGYDGRRRRESCNTRDRRAALLTATRREHLHWLVTEGLMSAEQLRAKERGREPLTSPKLAEARDTNVRQFLRHVGDRIATAEAFGGEAIVAALEQWIREEADGGLQPTSINAKLRGVQRFGDWLWRHGYIAVNAASRVKPLSTRGQKPKQKHQALTPAMAERLFAGQRGLWYRFRCWTGLRGSEAARIERRDLDLGDAPTLTVRPEVAKNGFGCTVPLARSLADALVEAGLGMSTGLLFPDWPSSANGRTKQLQEDFSAAGIGPECNGRSLRMTFVTWQEAAGVELGVRMKMRRDIGAGSVALTNITYSDPAMVMGVLRDALALTERWYARELASPSRKAVRA